MKQKTILYWTISAVLYLGMVVGGYSVNENLNAVSPGREADGEAGHSYHEGHAAEQSGHESDHSSHETAAESEVDVQVSYNGNMLAINLKDKHNKAPRLLMNHEKTMHLIVVSADLQHYYHLHPEDKGNGVFEQTFNLEDNSYKVFADIKPADLRYRINPIELHVGGSHANHEHNRLQADTEFVQTVDGKTVELSIDTLAAGESATLTFDSKAGKPEPYLGALGHVVIVDEAGERFIHVHPATDDSTVFSTRFDEPGIYKLWGEFKFADQVHVYPFVIEVK